MERYDSPTTVMYLDPPYLGNGANYKYNMRGEDSHLSIADQLGQAKSYWILFVSRYYGNEGIIRRIRSHSHSVLFWYAYQQIGAASRSSPHH